MWSLYGSFACFLVLFILLEARTSFSLTERLDGDGDPTVKATRHGSGPESDNSRIALQPKSPPPDKPMAAPPLQGGGGESRLSRALQGTGGESGPVGTNNSSTVPLGNNNTVHTNLVASSRGATGAEGQEQSPTPQSLSPAEEDSPQPGAGGLSADIITISQAAEESPGELVVIPEQLPKDVASTAGQKNITANPTTGGANQVPVEDQFSIAEAAEPLIVRGPSSSGPLPPCTGIVKTECCGPVTRPATCVCAGRTCLYRYGGGDVYHGQQPFNDLDCTCK